MREVDLGAHTIRSHGAKVARNHMHDWLILLLLVVTEIVLYIIHPFYRFVGKDMMEDLKYPFKDNTVPTWSVPLYAVLLPIAIFIFFYIRRRDVYDLHHSILALVGISRVDDYWHHWQDVFVGAILGLVVSAFCYMQFFPPPYSEEGWGPYAYFQALEESHSNTNAGQAANALNMQAMDVEVVSLQLRQNGNEFTSLDEWNLEGGPLNLVSFPSANVQIWIQISDKMPEIQLGAHTVRSHGVKVARTHMHDWLILLLLVVIDVILNVIEPFHRFVGRDMMTDLSYPLKDNTVPFWAVPVFNNVTTDVMCTGVKSVIKEGHKSFPSGHTSWSFAGLGFLSWYLSGKIRAFDRRGHVAKLCIIFLPLLVAALIGISRVDDYWHHWQDVFAGGLIGLTVASFCYLQFFPPPYDIDGWGPHAYFQMLAESRNGSESYNNMNCLNVRQSELQSVYIDSQHQNVLNRDTSPILEGAEVDMANLSMEGESDGGVVLPVEERLYGPELCAVSHRSQMNIGAKWLREEPPSVEEMEAISDQVAQFGNCESFGPNPQILNGFGGIRGDNSGGDHVSDLGGRSNLNLMPFIDIADGVVLVDPKRKVWVWIRLLMWPIQQIHLRRVELIQKT
ncbi:hypothetical protein GH714_018687 [Hevea brasiliensis]|uniref:Phosphatidic acid phosphatase type 2/haloperoxidase domain-containing protein n=1 Tax=Hevea brasiliensis TaxID=3981 RepID=A0A6A6MFD8_HEVBR|nr:hypothetical protein GH714_018687 [Hevea brasiliensis]